LRRLDTSDGILPTNIQTHKAKVDTINAEELAKLPGASCTYKSRDSGEELFLRALQANCPGKTEITLKRGAQVMLVKTIDASEGLVNGARGVVTRFMDTSHMPVVRFANGVETMIGFETWQILLGGRRVAMRRYAEQARSHWRVAALLSPSDTFIGCFPC
jgi:ATP-dependent DNA helicase PIF1